MAARCGHRLSGVVLARDEGSPDIEDTSPKLAEIKPLEVLESTSSSNNFATMNDQTASPEKGEDIVVITTTKGIIKARLFEKAAPKTVENFVGHIKNKYYDGIIFHRVIPDFMVQTGDPSGTGMGGESIWGGKFEDEFSKDLSNTRGALSMANAGPGTNGSQFFIVQATETSWLDGKHSVFGQVFEGMDVVDAIANAPRDAMDKPLEEISMQKVEITKY